MTKYEQIMSQISNGENEFTEFKLKLVDERTIGRLISGFANSKGGSIFFGVGDKGEIIGLTENEISIFIERLSRITSSILPIPATIEKFEIDNKNIAICQIPPLPEHLKPIRTASGEAYRRVGEATIKADDEKNKHISFATKNEVLGFVAMSFRTEEEPALDDYYNAMLRAVENTKLPIKLLRIDLNEGDFEISQKIMDEIAKADFVVCDFTLNPHNVYFEVGYARAKDRRIIQTARKGTELQFDVRNWVTLFYRNATDLEKGLSPKIIDAYNEIMEKRT